MWFPLPGRFFLCFSNGPSSQESLFPGIFSLQLQVGPGLLWAVRACVSLCPCHSVLGGSAEESGSQQTTGLRGWGQGLRRGRGEEAWGGALSGSACAQCPSHPVSTPQATRPRQGCFCESQASAWCGAFESKLQGSLNACSMPVPCQDLGRTRRWKVGPVFRMLAT